MDRQGAFLLCLRFGVPPPHGGNGTRHQTPQKDDMSDDTFTASDFESAASASSEPAASTSTPEESSAPVEVTAQPEGATTQPAVATTAPLSTEPAKPAGPIPFDVHKTALENARTKGAEEYRARYGWAEQVDPQEFSRVVDMARRASSDPIGYLQDFIKEVQQSPEHAQQLRSLAARALSQRQQQTAANQEPEFMVQQPDGSIVFDPNAFGQWKQWQQRQVLSQVQQELQPLKQTHEQQQREAAQAQWQQQWDHWQGQTVTDAHSWPGMDDLALRAQVAKAVEADIMGRDIKDVREIERAIDRAYRQIVVPSLHTASRQAVLNDINRQAAASTVNPAQTSTRAPKTMDQMSIAEALQHVAAQQA